MKKIKSLLILIVLFTIFVASVNAQALDNWVFGGNARINTISTSPTAATSMVNTLEGSSSISDSNGNLLFYTDGTNVWNRTNAIMPSVIPATGKLMGSSSSTTSSLIVPCDCNKYFIFTTDSTEHQYQNGLRYSVVDMNAPSGSGNGDVTSANNLLLPRSSEKIAAVAAPPSAGGGFWVVAHEIGTNRFFSYRIQANGNCTINPQSELNRISSVGKVFLGGGGNPSANFGQGEMKISPDGGKIAVAGTGWGNGSFIEVFR